MVQIAPSKPCVTEIIKNQLYLGNLPAALSIEQKHKLSITHIVSVCPDYPTADVNHLNIPIEDTEYEDILIKLPKFCTFIQDAISQGGCVLVHCVMGISRSSTVVAAFLMKSMNIPPSTAINILKKVRPQAHPNYGFIKQLDVFAKCNYQPSSSHPQYLSWQRRHKQDVNRYLNHIIDTVSIIPDKLLLNSEYPTDPTQARSLLLDLGITRLVSISPTEIPFGGTPVVQYNHFAVNNSQDDLLLELPKICACIHDVVKEGGLVLIHSSIESRVCIVACAYLITAQGYTLQRALKTIEDAFPLFHSTCSILHTLESFRASGYRLAATAKDTNTWSEVNHSPTKASKNRYPMPLSTSNDNGFALGASLGEALNDATQINSKPFIRVR